MSRPDRRQKLFVEPRMQGLLIFKIVLYWVNAFLTIGLVMAAWHAYIDLPQTSLELLSDMWGSIGPALVASLLLLPLIVMDCVRWSNRYAGPMVRLHDALRDLAEGKPVEPLSFRQGDLWFEMAEHFNRLARRMPRDRDSIETASGEDAAAGKTAAREHAGSVESQSLVV